MSDTEIAMNSGRYLWWVATALPLVAICLTAAHVQGVEPKPFELRDGDRVVLLGDGLIEQAAQYGFIETMLTARWPQRNITFRNLGWAADTPDGQSRTGFGPEEENQFDWQGRKVEGDYGFQKLLKQVADEKPTHLLVSYGSGEAFVNDGGGDRFAAAMTRLVERLEKTGAQIVLITPAPRERLGPRSPDPDAYNERLARAAQAQKALAARRGYPVVDLFTTLSVAANARTDRAPPVERLTNDGMHLNANGYRTAAGVIAAQLGLQSDTWRIELREDGAVAAASGVTVKNSRPTKFGLRFDVSDQRLPVIFGRTPPPRTIKVTGLKTGRYSLSIDGRRNVMRTSEEWAAGVQIVPGPPEEQVEQLRQAIIDKNQLYFHYFRPQNKAYIFLFRKYERADHAGEVQQWQRLAEKREHDIAQLRVAQERQYELVKEMDYPAHWVPRSIPKPDVEEELKSFKVADGFEVNLFAADPMVANPNNIQWDGQGRMWVTSLSSYPQLQPGEKPHDKIIVLEDTDRDGRADRRTVFADDLQIPHSMIPGDGGTYVTHGTELLHLQDTDGDGRADRRRVVLSGFGNADVHHMIHTLRWGPEGRLYFNQSLYINSHVETPWGPRRLMRSGVWQLDTRSLRLEVYTRGLCNPWGHAFDRSGQSFLTDGCSGGGIYYGFPGAGYHTAYALGRGLPGTNPGGPKLCGLEWSSGRHLPEDWRGLLLSNDFRSHRVVRYRLTENGSYYSGQQLSDLLSSSHPCFRPVDVKMGPDGAIYVADWYNPTVEHGEVDFHHPIRDHEHGRIWRITAKDRPLITPPQIVGATIDALLDALKLSEDWTRDQARRELRERPSERVATALSRWIHKLDPTDPAYDHHRLEALWVYESVDQPAAELVCALLKSPDHHVRAAAVRVLSDWRQHVPDALHLMGEAVADEHPQVRLEAVNALRGVGSAEAVGVAMRVLDMPMDPFLDYATWYTARETQADWMESLKSGHKVFGDNTKHLVFALAAVDNREVLQPLVAAIRAGNIPASQRPRLLQLVARWGGADEIATVLDEAIQLAGKDPAAATALLAAVQDSTNAGNPPGNVSRLTELLRSSHQPLKSQAVQLLGRWKVLAAREDLYRLAADERIGVALCQSAVMALARLEDRQSMRLLRTLTEVERPYRIQATAVAALTTADVQAAASPAVEILSRTPDGADPSPIFTSFLERKGGADVLARALASKTLPASVARRGIYLAGSSGLELSTLISALTIAGGLQPLAGKVTDQQMRELVAELENSGNAARGELVYRREDLSCMKCHSIGSAGGQVGPDLSSLGGSAQIPYLFESVLDPSAKLKDQFQTVVIETLDGRVLSGLIAERDARRVVLREGTDTTCTIPTADIDSLTPSPISLMPAGLTQTLRRDELVDLVRFLSELGRQGPYRVPTERFVRTWQVMVTSEKVERQLAASPESIFSPTAVEALNWKSIYSTVAGELPLNDLPRLADQRLSVARFRIQVTAPGKVALQLNDQTGLRLFTGQRMVPIADGRALFDVTKGTATITLVVDRAARRNALRVSLVEASGNGAEAQLVAGK